jgi:hypothetical protein
MVRVPWHLFKARQPRAHLLVAAMEADWLVGPNLQAAQSGLRFVRKQMPSSDYATTVVGEGGRPEFYLAFEDEDDARTVAACGGASDGQLFGLGEPVGLPIRRSD